jgi:opacity protein-like surface antigen
MMSDRDCASTETSETRAPRGALPLAAACVLCLLFALLTPMSAQAQDEFTMFSAFVGSTTGGDTTKAGANFGFSTAYIAESNWGAEVDVSHSTKFNDAYDESGLTTLMVNAIVTPRVSKWVRPYGVFGVGAIRARGCTQNCVREFSRTDFGLDAGGGVMVPVNDFFGGRGEVRYFRYAQVHNDLPRQDNGAFDFWRITFGAYIRW